MWGAEFLSPDILDTSGRRARFPSRASAASWLRVVAAEMDCVFDRTDDTHGRAVVDLGFLM
jgi:hypothetical protein